MIQHASRLLGLFVALIVVLMFDRDSRAAESDALADLADTVELIDDGNVDLARARLLRMRDAVGEAGATVPAFRRLIATAGLAKIDLLRQDYAGLALHAAAYARQAGGETPLSGTPVDPGFKMIAIRLLGDDLASAREALGAAWSRIAALRGGLPDADWANLAAAFQRAHVAYLMRAGAWAIDGWNDDEAVARIADALKSEPIQEVVKMITLNFLRSLAAGRLGDIETAERLALSVLRRPLVAATGSIAILELHLGCLQAVGGDRAAAAKSFERAIAAAERTGGRLNIGGLIQSLRGNPTGVTWPQDLDPRSNAYAVRIIPRIAVTLNVDRTGEAPVFVHAIDHTLDIEMRP